MSRRGSGAFYQLTHFAEAPGLKQAGKNVRWSGLTCSNATAAAVQDVVLGAFCVAVLCVVLTQIRKSVYIQTELRPAYWTQNCGQRFRVQYTCELWVCVWVSAVAVLCVCRLTLESARMTQLECSSSYQRRKELRKERISSIRVIPSSTFVRMNHSWTTQH